MLWASSGRFKDAAFLCCCVDPDPLATALDFERNYFGGAPASLLNAFIDSRADFPNFQASLGCQGFAIFDAARRLKISGTLPWTQHRDVAFRDLESKLRQILPQTPAPVGRRLRVTGLSSAKGSVLNGREGEVMGSADNGRWLVLVDGAAEPMALKPDNLEEPTKVQKSEVDELDTVDSVGHDDMDADHDRCIAALRTLRAKLSRPALRAARAELAEHFRHEEELLGGVGFGAAAGPQGLSAFDSHIKDHNRIVAMADEALAKLDGACDSVEGAVPQATAASLIRSFVEHATLYDALYIGKLEPRASATAA